MLFQHKKAVSACSPPKEAQNSMITAIKKHEKGI
jgi:hypothetical protein